MKIGTIVREKENEKRIGMIVEDTFHLCSREQIPVIFERDSGYEGTAPNLLEVLYRPQDIIATRKGCGRGHGEHQCAFLMPGRCWQKLRCGRINGLRFDTKTDGSHTNLRIPEKLYPNCQLAPESK